MNLVAIMIVLLLLLFMFHVVMQCDGLAFVFVELRTLSTSGSVY
uniref:Uncharacterized protein n=1 Tax=Arundo donax TaxID=35708 RepID=A0A0A9AP64_ARUDO